MLAPSGHASALLPDGTLVVTGGDGVGEIPSRLAFEFVPGSDTPVEVGALQLPRTHHTATPLFDGRILIVGGFDGYGGMDSIEVFDPLTSSFTLSAARLAAGRQDHRATGLADGRVLIRGGTDRGVAVAGDELYDPRSDSVSPAPSGLATATIQTDRLEYIPGEIVFVTGSGFAPGENVALVFDEDPLVHVPTMFATVADANGNVAEIETYHVDFTDLGTVFTLSAVGTSSGLSATTTFRDGAQLKINNNGVAPNPSSFAAGASFDVSVVVSAQGGGGTNDVLFTGVTVAAQNLPQGWQQTGVTPAPATLTGGNATVTFTVTIRSSSATPPGSYTVQVRASASTITGTACGSNPACGDTGTTTVTVTGKQAQTITFGPLPDKKFLDAPFTVSATASSGLPVTFTASGNCTSTGTNGGTITITGAGSCSVTADQAGNGTYNPAPSVTQTFKIAKADQTITFGPLGGKTWGDVDFGVSASASSGLVASFAASGSCSVSGSTVHLTGAGSCTITASQAGDANYNAAPSVSQSFTIAKAGQTITFAALPDKKAVDPPFTVSATASSGLAVGFAASGPCTASGTNGATITITGLGSCTVTASQAGDANFEAAPSVSQSFTISKADQTITFAALPGKTFGDLPFDLTATASSGLPISFTASGAGAACSVTGKTVTILHAGTCTITAAQAGNDSYNAAPSVDQTLTVQKKDQTITFDALPVKTFGDAPFDLGATATSGLVVTYATTDATCSITGKTVTILHAGTCNITASQAGNDDWNAAPGVGQTLTIQKKDQTITFDTLPVKTFGDAPFDLGAAATSGLVVTYATTDATCSISGKTVTILHAGACHITAAQPGDGDWNAAPSVTQTLTIQKKDQNIAFDPLAPRTFGDLPFALSATATSGLTVRFAASGVTCSVSGSTVTILHAGTCTITASQSGDGDWNAAPNVSQTFTIDRASQSIAFPALPTKTFGDPPFDLTAVAGSGLPVSFVSAGAACSVSEKTATILHAGTCTITAQQGGDGDWYPAPDVTRALTVEKADQTIDFAALGDRTWGDPDFSVSATAASSLAVTFSAAGNCTVSGATVNVTGAGTCTITASQAGDGDWNPAPDVARTFTIARKTLTVNANDSTMLLHGAVPTFTVTYDGFVLGEGPSALGGSVSCTTAATSTSDVGAYPITCGGLTSPNYAIGFVDGTLSIVYATAGACLGDAGHSILQPIDPSGLSVWKSGRTVPAKFRVCDANGRSIGTPGVVTAFYNVQRVAGTVATDVQLAVDSTTPDTQFRWDPTAQQWIFNLDTKPLPTDTTYVYEIRLKDGSKIGFGFGLKR